MVLAVLFSGLRVVRLAFHPLRGSIEHWDIAFPFFFPFQPFRILFFSPLLSVLVLLLLFFSF